MTIQLTGQVTGYRLLLLSMLTSFIDPALPLRNQEPFRSLARSQAGTGLAKRHGPNRNDTALLPAGISLAGRSSNQATACTAAINTEYRIHSS